MLLNPLNQPIFCPIVRYKSERNPEGPKIVLTCLNHGDEVIGLETAFEIMDHVKRNDNFFFGEIVIFSCLNYQGFLNSSRFFEAENQNSNTIPNLNRLWGEAESNNFSTIFATEIFEQILNEKPDLVLDLHSYGSNSLVHAILDRPGGDLENKMIEICNLSKLPFYLEYNRIEYKQQKLDNSLSNQLCMRGICAITIELGPKQSFNLTQSKLSFQAVKNLLISTGSMETGDIVDLYKLQNSDINHNTIYYRHGIYNDSGFSGYYRPLVNIGKFIEKDTKIIQIINLFGEVVNDVLMPNDGYILALEDKAVVYPKLQLGIVICEGE